MNRAMMAKQITEAPMKKSMKKSAKKGYKKGGMVDRSTCSSRKQMAMGKKAK